MSQSRCTACHAGMPTLSAEEIQAAIAPLEGWGYDIDSGSIYRTFEFKGYYKTMAFVNAIAWVAHTEKHHPDMQVSFNQVTVSYQTHEAGGITRNDIICAELVNQLHK